MSKKNLNRRKHLADNRHRLLNNIKTDLKEKGVRTGFIRFRIGTSVKLEHVHERLGPITSTKCLDQISNY
jgi:hypothetical protein